MAICTACFGSAIESDVPICRTCGGKGVLADPAGTLVGTTKDFRLFASKEKPLHASAIPELLKCTWRSTILYVFESDYESSEAADTGSMTHVAVAEWHRRKDISAAIESMRASDAKFPLANIDESVSMFLAYAADPRNINAEIAKLPDGDLFIEKSVKLAITPSPDDPTSSPIYITGKLDQVRVEDLRPKVWDLKTSKRQGWEQLNMYLYQIAAYAITASALLGRPVGMGGLITPRHYKQKDIAGSTVFWRYPHRFNDLEPLLNGIRNAVAAIRSGNVHPSPGEYCRYCPAHDTAECIPLLRSIVDPITGRIHLK